MISRLSATLQLGALLLTLASSVSPTVATVFNYSAPLGSLDDAATGGSPGCSSTNCLIDGPCASLKDTGGQCYIEASNCQSVVQQQTLAPLCACVLITPPNPDVVEKGTIVFTTGLGGQSFWSASLGYGPDALAYLQDLGYRTVEVAWDKEWWWVTNAVTGEPEGHAREACRPATLFRYAADNLRTFGTPFGGQGNSAGAGQIGYALEDYGLGIGATRKFDFAVFASGPPFADIDSACFLSPSGPGGLGFAGVPSKQTVDDAFGHPQAPPVTDPCFDQSTDPLWHGTGARWWASSMTFNGRTGVFPNVHVTVLHGDADQNAGAVGQATLYYNFLSTQTPRDTATVPGATHGLAKEPQGYQAIRDRHINEGTPTP